jgi:hypothetical protein
MDHRLANAMNSIHTDYRIVGCEACGTDGRLYVLDYCHGSRNEPPHWGDRDDGPCPYCEGTGGEIIEVEPIGIEDLGNMSDDFCLTHGYEHMMRRMGCVWCAACEERNTAIQAILRDVAELPDRNSPDDSPDMMLVTSEELRVILMRHL